MRVSRVALLTAAMFSAAVFAQDEEAELSDVKNVSAAPVVVKNEKSSSAVSAPISVAPVAEKEKSGPKLRFSGDFYVNPAWERENTWEQAKGEDKSDDKTNAFNILYNWNTSFGLDFNDNFSLDFRLSNKSGYECDNLAFENGSAKELLPYLPNAYFTWRAGDVFSLSGGLLEVTDNTVLNLVSGYENSGGLYTSYANWATEYNNSQGGLKFGFDFSENFSLNLTAALVNESREGEVIENKEFRFILDANIALGEKITLSPVFQARSYYKNYTAGGKEKSSILLAYGTDLNIELSDAVNLGFGVALGNIKGKDLSKLDGEKKSAFGLLFGISPEFTFGVNEISIGYSLGLASDKNDGKKSLTNTYHDTYCVWLFRVNDYFALGPSAYVMLSGSKTDGSENKSGYIWSRVGADFVVSF